MGAVLACIRRLLLIIPTLFGILLINFVIIQAAPGGPVEQMIAKLEGFDGATSRIAGGGSGGVGRRRQLPWCAGAGPCADSGNRKNVRVRQVCPGALVDHDPELRPPGLRESFSATPRSLI